MPGAAQGSGPLRLHGGRVLTPADGLVAADLLITGPTVTGLVPAHDPPLCGERRRDVTGSIVAPGFVDTHVHGALGAGFMDPGPEALDRIGRHLAAHGVTSCLATTVSTPAPVLLDTVARLGSAGARLGDSGVALAGIHLEGPFINPAASGVHRRASLRPPGRDEIARLHDAAQGALRVVTLAPELPGGPAAVELLAGLGVAVSLGHSTADFDQAAAAFDAGARRVTHCFNALPPVRAREPGAVLAALLDDRVAIEVIADGRHLAAPVLDLVHRVAGAGRVIAVSDGSDVAGLPDGPARRWEGTEVVLSGGEIRTPDGGLAGGAHALDHAAATLHAAGVPLADALAAVSSAPARHHGLHTKGRLEPGYDADVVVLTPDLTVTATLTTGHITHGTL